MVKVKIHRLSGQGVNTVVVSKNGGSVKNCKNLGLIICAREGDYLYFGNGEVDSFETFAQNIGDAQED